MDIVKTMQELTTSYPFAQFFLVGAWGALMYNFTLFFNEGLIKYRQAPKIMRGKIANVLFIISEMTYISVFGGTLATFLNHNLLLAFGIGFFSNLFVTLAVKYVHTENFKRAFIETIGRIVYEVTLGTVRRVAGIAGEALTKPMDKEKDKDNGQK